MDRRVLLHRLADTRALLRRLLPRRLEAPALDAWNRIQGGYRRRRADVVLVSYPKAGRTWLRLMLARALRARFAIDGPDSTDVESLHDADQRVPRIFATHDGVMPRMRPESVRIDKSRYAKQSVILLVRDPRDIVVSDYHHLRGRMGIHTGDLASFVLGDASGIETVLAFHRAWRDALDVPRRVLVVRYEDLHANPARELRRVLDFLGVDANEDAVAAALALGSFESMQAIERAGTHPNAALRTPDVDEPDARKVRRGRIGGYRDELDARTCSILDAKLREAGLARFGYAT